MRLAAHFGICDGDVDAWLKRISWDTLKEWLDFTDEEPIGEERADLRMGALASVIANANVDTSKIGGALTPYGYVAGWGKDRVYMLMIKPPEPKGNSATRGHVMTQVEWENMKINLIKVYGAGKRMEKVG